MRKFIQTVHIVCSHVMCLYSYFKNEGKRKKLEQSCCIVIILNNNNATILL